MDPSDHLSPGEGSSNSYHYHHQHNNSDDYLMGSSQPKRVGFSADTPPDRPSSSRSPEEDDLGSGGHNTPVQIQRPDVSHEELSEKIHQALGQPYVPKPRPAIRKTAKTPPQLLVNDEPEDFSTDDDKKRSGRAAQRRASKLSKAVGTHPRSRRSSNELLMSPPVELRNMAGGYESSGGETTDDDDDPEFMKHASRLLRQHTIRAPKVKPEDLYHSDVTLQSGQQTPTNEVEVEDEHVPRPTQFRTGVLGTLLRATNAAQAPGLPVTPNNKAPGHGRIPSAGSFTFSGASTAANSPAASPPRSGASTPVHGRTWYGRSHNHSTASISKLVESSSMLATPGQKDLSHEMEEVYKKNKPVRPGMGKRQGSDNSITSVWKNFSGKPKQRKKDGHYKIKVHIAGTLARQNYLRRLCKALMMYGAPTHRLEEYMNMSARVLEIEAQFLYMPGCMIIAFDDSSVHTSEVKLVRTAQGVDLGKLRDVHEIYKDVVHDRIGVEEATPRLEAIMSRKAKFSSWLRVPVYGLASAFVGPFAFQARPIDMPFCFILGCILGWLQLIVAPGNELISNVFEISAAVITSFVARGIGSIRKDGKEIFCFSAIAQSSIALILPGFMVLSASLELQSKHIVAGSVRMVYAIIYSLFLGFGITIGTVLFGLLYDDATSRTSCREPMDSRWYYLFVLGFSLCLMIINQAKWKQVPSMMAISLIGYVVNFHSSKYFAGNAQVSNTLGALAIGIAANLHARFGRHVENWSLDTWESKVRPPLVKLRKRFLNSRHGNMRIPGITTTDLNYHHARSESVTSEPFVPAQRKIGYGLAAAAMLPAIFVQVPSGLAVSGSLVSGITSADQITRNTTGVTTISSADQTTGAINSVALNVGFSVIQIAIGITVGLFMAALFVYPLGKRRSGLFSF
ncbi:DUF1212-domain-containing protein [Corynespora cassiicola Philippines]|uniref:DUF1212-domain-containing protein n=1 Tax=Corynespora cassiicola Philippines TaxID=1448308 RepID=A0A2T2PC71_CORCC|nr:DUF1212-domain-containing protein [Corynespora cassiicola Philippines]